MYFQSFEFDHDNVFASRQAENLCRSLAPADLGTAPLYVVRYSDADPYFRPPSAGAWTAGLLDEWLRPKLEQRGQWRGRGPAMLIRDPAAGLPGLNSFLHLVVHELAHRLERPRALLEIVDSALVEQVATVVYNSPDLATRPTAVTFASPSLPPWTDHALPFLRACSHLVHRGQSQGFFCSMSGIQSGGRIYGLSPGEAYSHLFADECAAWQRRSIIAIQAEPLPAKVLELWKQDTKHLLG